MNAFAATAVCATLAGLGAAALLFAPAWLQGPEGVRAQSVHATAAPSSVPRPQPEPILIVEAPDVPALVISAEADAPTLALPPSFALDLTFASAPLRRGFIDGSPVFSADVAPAVPSGGGALRLHFGEPSPVPAAESPPLSGAPVAPPLARLARSTVLQVRPPLRPSFADPASSEAQPQPEPEPAAAPAAAPAASPWGGLFGVAARPDVTPSRPRPAQTGTASWYGPGFHGRRTASGERFNQNDMTAAHPHLPFGSRVRVVDERTGRSVVVRINDRGPFKPGRIIDLSKGSAQALGMGGLARVQLVSAE